MYLDISEQARNILAAEEIRENELYGLCHPATVFKFSGVSLPPDVERFLALNGKFQLHPREPLDDLTLLQHWTTAEYKALWDFWFRNKKQPYSRFSIDLHVKSDALVPDDIPDVIQQGLDAGCAELLSQAAHARSVCSENSSRQRLNPWVSAVKSYLITNDIMIKPTDKNLGLSAFPTSLYRAALASHLSAGPYELVHEATEGSPLPSAFNSHADMLARLPKDGLTKQEVKFIREHRVVEWPAFHMIPKVHKEPWAWRPIVPAHLSPTTRLSKVADIVLSSPAVLGRFPHLIRSTAEWVRAFHKGIDKASGLRRTWLVTGDVEAFYTNIDTETIDRSMEALMTGSRIPRKRAMAIAWLVRTVTHKNFFAVDGKLYRQTQGLAMGSPCSGTVANLALARREKKLNVSL